jgi:hypothetical protein
MKLARDKTSQEPRSQNEELLHDHEGRAYLSKSENDLIFLDFIRKIKRSSDRASSDCPRGDDHVCGAKRRWDTSLCI